MRRFVPGLLAVALAAGLVLVVGVSSETSARAGRADPSAAFASLAEAASQPVGKGLTTDTPAADVRGGAKRVDPEEVLPQDGRLVNGCVPGYGDAGACLPQHGPGKSVITCGYIKTITPEGFTVTGADPLGLDTNDDGVACGPGDRGVGGASGGAGAASAHSGHG